MLNEKRIKTIIIITLLLIEAFVWTANGVNNSWSLGFLGGSDGPAASDNDGDNAGGGKENPGTGNNSDNSQQGGNDGVQPGDNTGNQPGNSEEETDNKGYPPADNKDRELALKEAKEKGFLILVNKQHPIDQNYKPEDLKKINYYAPDRSEAGRYMREEAADAFNMLVEKAASKGIEIKMTTAYRSYEFQKILFDSYVAKEGEEKANTYSARPGQSEHQTGLSVDVSSPSVNYQLSGDYGETEEGKWLADNAYRFGFILRFPLGKEDITGYQYEPWHIRYVGLTAAKEIHAKNLTLEEYLEENNIQ